MERLAQKLVDELNRLLEIDPKGISKLALTMHTLDISVPEAEKMLFVCGLNKYNEVELGAIGVLNSILVGTNKRIAYNKLKGTDTVVEFALVTLGDISIPNSTMSKG